MKRHLSVIAITCILFGVTARVPAAVIALTPSVQSVNEGNEVVVEIGITGLGDATAPSLGVYDIDVAYDPSVLVFNRASFGTELDLFGLGSVFSATALGNGMVNVFELSLDLSTDLENLQAPGFTLVSLAFGAVAPGTSSLAMTLNALGDANGDELSAELESAIVTVTPVPLPGGLGLLVIGLSVLSFRRRRGQDK